MVKQHYGRRSNKGVPDVPEGIPAGVAKPAAGLLYKYFGGR